MPLDRSATLTPPPAPPAAASTEVIFLEGGVGAATSGPRRAIARRGWTRGQIAASLATWDVSGIGAALVGAWSQGWTPDPVSWAALVLGPMLVYIGGGYSVPMMSRPWTSALAAVFGSGVAALAMVTAGLTWQPIPPVALVAAVVVAAWPAVARIIIGRLVCRRVATSRWLVLGTPEVLAAFERERAHGAVLGDCQYLSFPGAGDLPERGVLGPVETLGDYLNRRWTGIVVASPEALDDATVRLLMMGRLSGTRIYDLAEYFETFLRKVPVLHLRAGWVVLSQGFHLLHNPISHRLKRMSDILIALSVLVLTVPLMGVVAIAVRLTSPGPVLFRQERIGARGKRFTVLKFRSMRVGSERGDKYTQSQDPRLTSIGGFLRKSRLDELPQLWNILRGDMSFVGPRAEWTRCVEAYEHAIPFYHLRHVVKPGLTGWAQVHYPYGASVQDAIEKLQYDLWYIKHYSLFLDLRILLKTFRVVVFGMGR